ncbi:MAG: class I SAM-dependent methyltransferase [Acidobacteriota bacterium]|nr:class I SAM-dependent methyltransferase [Acidobacteriota bacterium]
MWDELGKLQFDMLMQQGLKPKHFLLDVGCGSLRGGVHFIRHLEPGHYFGIDKSRELLEAGRRIELARHRLKDRNPVLVVMHDFEFSTLNQRFDFALAQSVFTHLPLNQIIRCIVNVERVLVSGGKFLATFFENRDGKFSLQPTSHPATDVPAHSITTYFDRDPYHYSFETFTWICEGTNLRVEYVGAWDHPRNQKLMIFTKV